MFSRLWKWLYCCNKYYCHSFKLFLVTSVILTQVRYHIECGLASVLEVMKIILCFLCNKILLDKNFSKTLLLYGIDEI